MPAFSNACCAVDGTPATLTAFGGLYDWGAMPLRPDDSATEKQKTAIAGLMSDLGIACGMSYGSAGSAVGSYMLARAWTTCFGYASAMAYALPGYLPAEVVKRALISNFDARLPVEIGISGASGGHAVVGDGYGYSDGTLYYHLNMGWDGNGNAWYAPPDLSAGGYSFSAFGCVVYNIFPELSAGHTICSGRVLDANGMPIAGATVHATDFWSEHYETTADDHGIYALILPSTWVYPLPYTIHAELGGKASDELSVKVKMCVSTLVNPDGTFNSDTAPAPAINNLIDQDLTISSVFGDAPEGDYFANPIQIAGASGSHLLEDTSGYSLEEGEPHHTLDNGSYHPEARSAWYSWTAPGSGEMSFTVLSRHKIGSTTHYLHAMVAVYRGESLHSAERIALFDGFDDDGTATATFEAVHGERYRIVVFAYAGDPFPGPFALSWEGELALADATQTTEIPVPHSWLAARYPEADDFEKLAFSRGANGRPVWESYLLGLESTNAMSDLRITQFWIDGDGTPNFGWNVTNENLRALGYEYRIKGKTKLEGEEPWRPPDATHRFFRLFVERPR